jgi:two-component system nitrogen regulation response regulator GlnG
MAEIWVIDDDRSVRFVLAEALRADGFAVREFERATELLAALQPARPDLVFTDVRMPETDGLQLLDALKRERPQLPVIVMSAWTDVPSTAGAFRGGALDFLSKPFDLDTAVAMARRVLEVSPASPASATEAAEGSGDAAELLGDSPAMRELFRALGRLAQAPLSVLVTGETGTGKELVARALHRHSPRAARPFVALNTAAIPSELLESELFGHEAGAFTGASKRHIGRFEQADGGTLFLDEIGDMPQPLQTRLLRVLAEGEFFRVGGRELIRVDVRVIAATHQDLDARASDGRFRADLLHRLDVVRLALPPLRARREDVAPLAQRFLAQATRRVGATAKRFAPDALARLAAHDWPGNVRELENLCWRLAALVPGDTVRVADLPLTASKATATAATPQAAPDADTGAHAGTEDWSLALRRWADAELAAGRDGLHARASERMEQVLLDAALQATGGHRQQAAARLGLGRNTITRKLGRDSRRR